MVYSDHDRNFDLDRGCMVPVGAPRAISVWVDAMGVACDRSFAFAGLRSCALHWYCDDGDYHSAFFPLPPAVGAAEWSAGTGWSCWPATACLHAFGLSVPGGVDDCDFPRYVYAAGQSVGGLHMPSVPVRLAMQIIYIVLLLTAGWGLPRRTRT